MTGIPMMYGFRGELVGMPLSRRDGGNSSRRAFRTALHPPRGVDDSVIQRQLSGFTAYTEMEKSF
jgi:hypothetical protein